MSSAWKSKGSLAACSASSMIASITGWMPRWANITPPSTSSSVSSWISDSTIITASSVPATTRSMRLPSPSWSRVGFSTYSPSMKPTRAAPIGPMKGTPESVRAAEAATMATMSGSFSRSWASTVTTTWVSFLKPLTNSGRIGRSIRRETRVSFSRRAAFALEEAAGDLARGVGLLLVVDGQREEVEAGLGRSWRRRRWPAPWSRRRWPAPRRRPDGRCGRFRGSACGRPTRWICV